MGIHESISFIFFFATFFGICYLYFTTRHRERMSLIDKGIAPDTARPMDHPMRSLKNGLLMIGIGIGAVVGFFFQEAMGAGSDYGPMPYAVGMAICGGLALVLFYAFFGRKQQG